MYLFVSSSLNKRSNKFFAVQVCFLFVLSFTYQKYINAFLNLSKLSFNVPVREPILSLFPILTHDLKNAFVASLLNEPTDSLSITCLIALLIVSLLEKFVTIDDVDLDSNKLFDTFSDRIAKNRPKSTVSG